MRLVPISLKPHSLRSSSFCCHHAARAGRRGIRAPSVRHFAHIWLRKAKAGRNHNPRVGGSSPSSGTPRKPRYGGVFSAMCSVTNPAWPRCLSGSAPYRLAAGIGLAGGCSGSQDHQPTEDGDETRRCPALGTADIACQPHQPARQQCQRRREQPEPNELQPFTGRGASPFLSPPGLSRFSAIQSKGSGLGR